MAKGMASSLAKQIAELEEKTPKDFDPEENERAPGTDESGSEEEDENLGTEHYVDVGKSKLRKPVEVALGPQYVGARVSRKDLLNDDESEEESNASEDEEAGDPEEDKDIVDPETVDLDAEDLDGEIDSDEALGNSDDEKFKEFMFRGSGKPKDAGIGGHSKRKTAADFMSGSEDEDMEVDEDEVVVGDDESDEDEDMSDGGAQLDGTDESGSEGQEELSGDDDEEEEDEEESDEESEEESDDDDEDGDDEKARRAELRKMMSEEQKTVVATISQAAKVDAEKGQAVKAQRKTFDSLLNVRIRLQKALVATNSMTAAEQNGEESTPYKAAEEAAVKLLNTLNAMRHELDKTGAAGSKKRKRATIDISTASADIWANIQASESQSVPKRQATLEKWSAKVRGTTATPVSRKLNNTAEQSITNVLTDQLSGSNAERLVNRTKMPRSCAPVQVKAKVTEDANIYDDADFYQLLLKELVDQRMVDSSSAPSMGSGGQPIAQWAAVKEAKTKKNVDTKASKGRKMKFTVHEKLQNFMAPEDRAMWESDAIDRFFGTLLGQKMNLGEDEESEGEEEAPLAEEALMLFRS